MILLFSRVQQETQIKTHTGFIFCLRINYIYIYVYSYIHLNSQLFKDIYIIRSVSKTLHSK